MTGGAVTVRRATAADAGAAAKPAPPAQPHHGPSRSEGPHSPRERAARATEGDRTRLANALNVHEGQPPDRHSEASVLRDGFGPEPAFSALVAEREGEVVGYALFHDLYDTDLAARGVWLLDLFVDAPARRLGAGRALLRAVAAAARERGAASVRWTVLQRNARARAFYRAHGAHETDALVAELEGDALAALGDERSAP